MKTPLILDTGALLAVLRRSRSVWVVLDEAQREDRDVLVPAGTLVESIRGGAADALINRLLNRPGTEVTPHDEQGARLAGKLLSTASTSDPIDALVVAEAYRRGGATIATSDPVDIRDLANGHRHVQVVKV